MSAATNGPTGPNEAERPDAPDEKPAGGAGAPTGSPAAPAVPAAPAKPRKRRRWLRRIGCAAAILFLLLVVLRFALPFVLPSIIAKVAKGYGLSCTYERLHFSVLGGSAELWHLVVAPIEGGEPFVHLEYACVDVATTALLRGKIVVRRLEVDGLDLLVDRDAEGKIALLERIGKGAGEEAPEPPEAQEPEAEEEEEPGEFDLRVPIAIDAFRAQHVHLRVRDASVSPPFDARFDVNVRLSDLGSDARPARFHFTVASSPLLDRLDVEGEARDGKSDLSMQLRVLARGFHPRALEGHLALLGIRAAADALSFDLHMDVGAETTDDAKAVKALCAVDGIRLAADGEEALALDRFVLAAGEIRPDLARIGRILLEGGRVHARRLATGAVRIAGLEIPPAAAGERAAIDLSLVLDELSIHDVLLDPSAPEAPVPISTRISAPGIFRSLVLDGVAVPFAARKTFDAKIRGDGIAPDALGPLLAELGAESLLKDGKLACALHAAVEPNDEGLILAEFAVEEMRFEDAGELLAAGGIRVSGISVDPQTLAIAIDEIAGEGPRLDVRRDASGGIAALGIRVTPGAGAKAAPQAPPSPAPAPEASPQAEAPTAPVEPPKADEAGPAPRIEIRHLAWNGVQIRVADETVSPANEISIADAGAELKDLRVDFDPKATPPPAASVRAWLAAPGLADRIDVTGTMIAKPNAPRIDLAVAGGGITARAAAPYLAALGLEPMLVDGRLALRFSAEAKIEGETIGASLAVREVSFRDGERELAGLDAVRIDGVEVRPVGIRIGTIEIDKPRAKAWRDADGAIAAFGIRVPPPAPPAPAPAEGDAKAGADVPAPAAPAPPAPAARGADPKDVAAAPAAPFVLDLERFAVRGAEIGWTDEAIEPAIAIAPTCDVTLTGLAVGREAPPARLEVAARIPETIDAASISGTIAAAPSGQGVSLAFDVKGLRAGPLAAYFPEGTALALQDGRVRARLEAGVGPCEAGGSRASLSITGIEYREGAEGEPLLAIDAIRAIASRIDPDARIIAIDEVSLAGLAMDAERTEDGALRVLGVSIAAAAPPADASTGDGGPEKEAPASTSSSTSTSPAEAAPGGPSAAAAPAPAAPAAEGAGPTPSRPRAPLPLVTLEKLDVGVKRISVTDRARKGSSPVSISNVRIRNAKRIELLGDEPETKPPLEIAVEGEVGPAIESFAVTARAEPFAADPSLAIDIGAGGIRGEGLLAIAPELEELIDGAQLTDGRFHAGIELALKARRRHALDFDLSQGFGLEASVKDVAFREGAEGPVLLGVDEVRADVARIDPAGGVHVKTIEITKPKGRVVREKDGIHALGLVVKIEEPKAEEGAKPEGEAEAEPAAQTVAEAPEPAPAEEKTPAEPGSAPPAPAGPEIRVDKLYVSDIDFLIEDRSGEPAMTVPLEGLDVEVRGITTRAFSEPVPIRLHAVVRSGKVRLPKTLGKSSIVGAITDTAAVVTGGEVKDLDAYEERPFFEEIIVNGRIALAPVLSGWVKIGISALDLANLKGPAAASGMTLDGGVFDSGIDVRFRQDGSMDVNSRFTFTDLSVSEPANGPIVRYLKLPAPLGTVLFVLRDEAGAIVIPLGIHLEPEGIGLGQIAGTAVKTLGALVGRAIARSGLRAATGVTNVVGGLLPFGGGEAVPGAGEKPATVGFEPGETAPSREQLLYLGALIDRMRENEEVVVTLEHKIGGGDIPIAAGRANPPRDEAIQLAAKLRAKRSDLERARAEAAAEARASLIAGLAGAADTARERLRAIDREISLTERALDRTGDLLRPGAERQAVRRTREACVEIGRARLQAVRDALVRSGIPRIEQRIDIRRPRFTDATEPEGGTVVATPTVRKGPS
ncbi:MAG: DUF748 domain-containing protein [Planctomycetes bacterium]|nr:DUF748 domain-containing protein [Planctomycetota bacterium]